MNSTALSLRRFAARAMSAWGCAAALLASTPAAAVDSIRLVDTIKSSGSASINLMLGSGDAPITATQLEALRLEHRDATNGPVRHYLSLAIDVNENAKGLENSNAMGITLAQVMLTVTTPTATRVYSEFRTQTRALLAPAGSPVRQYYYTALGEAGSSRITANNAVQSTYDSTIDIFVPDSLADATSAVLQVKLLDVNKAQGDPESFYDYSGGYEDLALLNRTDALYLNTTLAAAAPFRADAPAVEPVEGIVSNDTAGVVSPNAAPSSWAYFPSASGWYQVAYEDNFPKQGDYDFNDTVVAYRYRLALDGLGRVMRVEVESYLVAEGAWYTVDWNFRLPVAGAGTLTCTRRQPGAAGTEACTGTVQGGAIDIAAYPEIDNSGRYFDGTPSWAANSVRWAQKKQGADMSAVYVLDVAIEQSAVGTPDPWLYVRDTGQSIRLDSRDPNGFPFALLLPMDWRNPYENVDMGVAYPRFRAFVESGGAQETSWYLHPDAEQVFDTSGWPWGP